MKLDIENRNHIEFLVAEFYKLATKDELIGKFFTTVMVLNWEKHIPVICNFWESMILGSHNYQGNQMLKHIELSRKEKLLPEHFERWQKLWKQTIDNNFEGKNAMVAKQKAHQIGGLMLLKVASNP